MSYLYKISGNNKVDYKVSANDIIKESSMRMKNMLDVSAKEDFEESLFEFTKLAHFAQVVSLAKNTQPKTVSEASKYADAHEYYMETLKEVSTVMQSIVDAEYGPKAPAGILQEVVTYVSEIPIYKRSLVKKFIKSKIITPRKSTTNKRKGNG